MCSNKATIRSVRTSLWPMQHVNLCLYVKVITHYFKCKNITYLNHKNTINVIVAQKDVFSNIKKIVKAGCS